MLNWWESLSSIQQAFAGLAIPATLLMLLQTILLMFGAFGSGGDGCDTDVGNVDCDTSTATGGFRGGGLRIFTVRGIVTFFAIFGWTGVVLLGIQSMAPSVAITIAFAVGVLALVATTMFFKYTYRLQSSGNIDYRGAAGKTGTVYLTIPPNGIGQGKINLVLGGCYVEMLAITNSDIAIPTGTQIILESITEQNIAYVAIATPSEVSESPVSANSDNT